MALSTFTAFSGVTEGAPVSPSYVNAKLSAITQNLTQLNQDAGNSDASLVGWNKGSVTTILSSSTRIVCVGRLEIGDAVGSNPFLQFNTTANQVALVQIVGGTLLDLFTATGGAIQLRPNGGASVATLETSGRLVLSGSTINLAEANAGGGLTGTATGTAGDISWGSSSGVSYLYVCVSANSWMRAVLSPF